MLFRLTTVDSRSGVWSPGTGLDGAGVEGLAFVVSAAPSNVHCPPSGFASVTVGLLRPVNTCGLLNRTGPFTPTRNVSTCARPLPPPP